MVDRISTKELLERLRRHYIKPSGPAGGVFVPECGVNGTFGASRRCDALYAGFTSSSGRILIGHELKVSRADWLHELDQREKADQWADACHAWYVVAPSEEIVPLEELPEGWGLLVINPRSKTRLRVACKAVARELDPPWWAVRSMMGRLDAIMNRELAEREREHRVRVTREVEERAQARRAREGDHETRTLRETVDRLEAAFGVKLDTYSYGDQITPEALAAALSVVAEAETLGGRFGSLPHTLTQLERLSEELRALQKAVRTVGGTP